MGNDKVANAPTATHLGPLPLGGVKAHFNGLVSNRKERGKEIFAYLLE